MHCAKGSSLGKRQDSLLWLQTLAPDKEPAVNKWSVNLESRRIKGLGDFGTVTPRSIIHQLEFQLVFGPRILPHERGTGPYLPLGNGQAEGSEGRQSFGQGSYRLF